MGKANFWYNARDRRWELRNRAGTLTTFWSDSGFSQDEGGRVILGVASMADVRPASLTVGGGTALTQIGKHTGTLPSIAVGTGLSAIATLTGLGSAAIAVGDLIFVNAKVGSFGNVMIGGARIPTTNVVNVFLTNPNQADVGSIAHVGIDVIRTRF